MANFHTHPGGSNINGQSITVTGTTYTVGLWGPKDFDGKELNVVNSGDDLVIFDAGTAGNSNLYKINVTQKAQKEKATVTETISAITQSWSTWSEFTITFKKPQAVQVNVRNVTAEVLGGPSNDPWRSTRTPAKTVMVPSSLVPGDPKNTPTFTSDAGHGVLIAVFQARVGTVERGYILMRPQSNTTKKLMVVISHGFGQQDAYYMAKGYNNPLSPDLVKDVLERFVLQRWGAQLMAASRDYSLLFPIRAKAGGGATELGPFQTNAGVGASITKQIAQLAGIGLSEVEVVTFSSGIWDANTFVGTGGKGLTFTRGTNQDPAGGAPLVGLLKPRRQFLSGGTTHGVGRPGFELLNMPRWENEPNFKDKFGWDNHNYLHSWCLPDYTLFLALKS